MERNEGKTSAERRMDIWIFFKWRKLSLTEQTNCVRRRKSSWDMAKKKGLKNGGNMNFRIVDDNRFERKTEKWWKRKNKINK